MDATASPKVFSVPVPITRPRYALSEKGKSVLAQMMTISSTATPLDQWYVRILTAWRDAISWASMAPEELGPPPGVRAEDMDPSSDRLRIPPLIADAVATFDLKDHIPETIVDPYQRMLVALVQTAECTTH